MCGEKVNWKNTALLTPLKKMRLRYREALTLYPVCTNDVKNHIEAFVKNFANSDLIDVFNITLFFKYSQTIT
jgi:hypothetical protein